MQLTDIYKAILASAHCSVDKDGFVFTKSFGSEKTQPLTIDGKRLVLPTPEQLQVTQFKERLVFHPLYENAMRAESDVVSKLRSMLSIRLSFTMTAIMAELLNLAASVALHKKLNPTQSAFLSAIGPVDENTAVNFSKYITNLSKENKHTNIVNIYLKRGGMLNKKPYNRTGIATFQSYKDFKENIAGTTSVGGVKFRAKDKEAIVSLFEYILPEIQAPEAYCVGTNSNVAPYTDALMRTFGGIAARINDIVELFGKNLSSHEDLVIPFEWAESFDNLADLLPTIRSVPMQLGNEGAAKNPKAANGPTTAASVSGDVIATPVGTYNNAPAPVATVQPQAVIVAEPPRAAPGPNAGFFANLSSAPLQYPMAPVMPMYQAPMAPPVVITENGVDFRSAMNSSGLGMMPVQLPPALAMQGGYGGIQPGFNTNPYQQFQPRSGHAPSGGMVQQYQQPVYNNGYQPGFQDVNRLV